MYLKQVSFTFINNQQNKSPPVESPETYQNTQKAGIEFD